MNNKQQIQKRIQQTELQLKKLSLNMNSSDVCEDLYNSLIIQKAVLNKQLKDLNKNPLIEKVKKIIPHEKRICDYFKEA